MSRQGSRVGMRGGRVAGSLLACVGGLLAGCDVPTDLPRFESMYVVPTEQLAVPVVNQPVSVSATHDLAEARTLVSRTRAATLVVDVENGAAAHGRVDLRISNGKVDVMASIDTQGETQQRVPLMLHEIQSLLGSVVTTHASGTLCHATGCATVGPSGRVVTLRARFELMLEVAAETR